jgi:hypothetical protein
MGLLLLLSLRLRLLPRVLLSDLSWREGPLAAPPILFCNNNNNPSLKKEYY